MFLDYFPKTLVTLSPKNRVVVPDLVRAVRLDPILKNDPALFDVYIASDDEDPEVISHKVYGTTAYHWVIMLLNEKFDPYADFPKSDKNLRKFCQVKYADPDGLHHYEDGDNNWVDEFRPDKTMVTNFMYEVTRNESLRQIKIMRKELLSEFVQLYRNAITS